MIKFCKKYVLRYKMEYIVYIGTGIILCLLSTMLPTVMGQFINMFAYPTTMEKLFNYIIFLMGLYIGKEILGYINRLIYIRVQTNAAFSLNLEVIEHLKKISSLVLKKTDLSYLSQRINNDANDILIFFINGVTELVFSLISSLIILIMILRLDVKAFVITLILIIVYFCVYVGFKKEIYKKSYDMKEEKANFFSKLQEQLEKSEFIKIHGVNNYFVEKLVVAYKKLYASVIRQQSIVQLFSNIEGIIGAISVCILLGVGGVELIRGNIEVGYFFIITTYFNMILEYGKQIVGYGQEYQEAYVSYERIISLLQLEEQPNGKIILENVNNIEIQNLSFSYENKKIVKNLNLILKKGNLYGIKGANGCGKSTLVKILMGLYIEEYEGKILWNGIEMKNLDMQYLRETLIGFTEQEPILIADTVFNNMVLYKNTDKAIVKRASNIFKGKIIKEDNWGFLINEKSTNISGGEKQKIAIIRQIIKNGEVLIFDEPTSALDIDSKKQFLEFLSEEKDNKIILLVSHDSEVLKICDEILEI